MILVPVQGSSIPSVSSEILANVTALGGSYEAYECNHKLLKIKKGGITVTVNLYDPSNIYIEVINLDQLDRTVKEYVSMDVADNFFGIINGKATSDAQAILASVQAQFV